MTKKDYERAATIAQEFDQEGCGCHAPTPWSEAVKAFVRLFHDDGNPRFDEARFRRATCQAASAAIAKAEGRE